MRTPELTKSIQVILFLLFASIVSHSALAQIPVEDEGGNSGETRAGIYAKPLNDSTAVRAIASPNARVIDRIPSNTVLVTVSSEGEFEEVRPQAGSDLFWEAGYIGSDQLEIGIDLPWRTSGSIFGSLAAVSPGESVLSVNDVPAVSNPFGQPGTSGMFSLGLTVGGGYFVPVGETGFKVRLDGEYSFIQGNDQAQNVDSTSSYMIRVGAGGSMVYRMTPMVDVSVGAVAGGGQSATNCLWSTDRQLQVLPGMGPPSCLLVSGAGATALVELVSGGDSKAAIGLARKSAIGVMTSRTTQPPPLRS